MAEEITKIEEIPKKSDPSNALSDAPRRRAMSVNVRKILANNKVTLMIRTAARSSGAMPPPISLEARSDIPRHANA
jgi:hypothetical protein